MEQPSYVPQPVRASCARRMRAEHQRQGPGTDKISTGASAIAYVSIIAFIFSVRYLDVIRWGFKLTWMILGITIAAEAAGKAVMNTGIASQLRPRRYYTVPRETLDVLIGDVHELVNFLVIESQRIVFAENIWASLAVCIPRNQLATSQKLSFDSS